MLISAELVRDMICVWIVLMPLESDTATAIMNSGKIWLQCAVTYTAHLIHGDQVVNRFEILTGSWLLAFT